jgi:hypothetical protein
MHAHHFSRSLLAIAIACTCAGLVACGADAPGSWDEIEAGEKADIGDEDVAAAQQEIYVDSNMGSVLGAPVVQNNTCGAGNHFFSGCGSSSAHDRAYHWTAPSSGNFTFSTAGSSYDTVIQIMNEAQTASLGCNDDSNGTLQSSITLNLSAGQKISIVVDGYGGSCGAFKLNIAASGGGGYWTSWFDRDEPSGNGDYETLHDFKNEGYPVCASPIDIQCQTLNGVDWTQTGEVYTCAPSQGGSCVNSQQPDGSCQDYRVRFLCP